MHSPTLQLVSSTHFCKGGDVDIDPSVAIAPGVVIRSESGSRIIVSAGVCIGAGAIIQAYHGDLLLEDGVNLGAGTLILGHGRIGANVCVGSAATVINPALEPNQVIASGALIGDLSRCIPDSQATSESSEKATVGSPQRDSQVAAQTGEVNHSSSEQTRHDQNGASAPAADQPANLSQVYGRRQIDQLLITLFPHRQPLNPPIPPDSS